MMNTINSFNVARSDRHFLIGSVLMACSALALFFVLVAWAVGGSEFKNSFYGDGAIVVLGAGFIVGATLAAMSKESTREQ
jgi:hypothetical protein